MTDIGYSYFCPDTYFDDVWKKLLKF